MAAPSTKASTAAPTTTARSTKNSVLTWASVVSARICAFTGNAGDGRTTAQWLSPGDMARLIEAGLALDDGAHHILWGVSANAPGWFSLDAGFAIGYHPQDDARAVAIERDGVVPPEPDTQAPLGDVFTDEQHPVGGTW